MYIGNLLVGQNILKVLAELRAILHDLVQLLEAIPFLEVWCVVCVCVHLFVCL